MPDWERISKLLREKTKYGQPWWAEPLNVLGKGAEQTFTSAGAFFSSPFRAFEDEEYTAGEEMSWWEKVPPISFKEFVPGGREYEAYQRYKGSEAESKIPIGIPSWRQMEEWNVPFADWFAEGDKPEGYEMAQLGLAETAEIAPLLFIGGGAGKNVFQKITDLTQKNIAKGMSGEQAVNQAFNKIIKSGAYEKYSKQGESALQKVLGDLKKEAKYDIPEMTKIKPTALAKVPEAVSPVGKTAVKEELPKTTALTRRMIQIPQNTLSATNEQKVVIHQIKKTKNLTERQYRQFLKRYTGKDSAKYLTREQADSVIGAMEGLVLKNGKVVIPQKTSVIEKALVDQIPAYKDIGFFDIIRQKNQILRQKFQSWGRETTDNLLKAELAHSNDLALYRKQSDDMLKLIKHTPDSKARVFNALENPLETHLLNESEQTVFKYFRDFFDKWAKDLKLPKNKTRKNYVTHIFEEQFKQELREKKALPMELMAAMDYNAAKTVFMPYLQQRFGKNVGLKLDPFAAADVYEYYALKKLHYEPLIQKMSAYSAMLREIKPSHSKYLDEVVKRLSGRPSFGDMQLNKAFGDGLKKMTSNPEIAKLVPDSFKEMASKGNMAAMVAYNQGSLYYMSWLGFRPVSAIRNLSQQLLAVADTSVMDFAKGQGYRMRMGLDFLKKNSITFQGRLMGQPMAGLEEAQLRRMPKKLQDWSLGMFKWADKQNVANSFYSGYAKGKRLKLPEEWCIKLGDEVAQDTQYLYTKMARSLFEESTIGRFVTPFTSWPRNFLELQNKWITGRQSFVLQEYERQTGKKVLKDSFTARHKAFATYLTFLTGAYAVEGVTDFKAVDYTGWTSIGQLGRLVGGDIPALQIPAGLAYLVAGGLDGDERMIKEGWNNIRPDKFVQIIRQLEGLAEGKQDPMTLFFYIEKAKEEDRKRVIPSDRTTPPHKR